MAEEHRIQEGHRLCANNCGLFGSPATQNLCSKCYGDFHTKQQDQKASSLKSTVGFGNSISASSSSAAPLASPPPRLLPPAPDESAASGGPSRCFACRKRVGLIIGFKCRCGFTFCGAHRYPEQHDCSFDFKKVGREAIARDNPVIKAQKLERI